MARDVVTILAGGYSASRVDLRKLPGFTIAVNDSARYSPRWDVALSMDRLWYENRREEILKQLKPIYMRLNAIKQPLMPAGVNPFECDHESTTLAEPGAGRCRLNGTHSGFCALNLAYHWRPRELFLVGFDMELGPRGEKHWYPDYPWSKSTGAARLAEWSKQFATAAQQMRDARMTVHLVESNLTVPGWPNVTRKYMEESRCRG